MLGVGGHGGGVPFGVGGSDDGFPVEVMRLGLFGELELLGVEGEEFVHSVV